MAADPLIMIVIGNLNVGGAEQHLLRVMPQLQQRGFNIAIYTITAPGQLAPAMQQEKVPVLAPPAWRTLNKLGKIGKLLLLGVSLANLTILLIKRRPAVVHFYLPKSYLLGGVAAWLAQCKCWVMSRRVIYNKKYQNKLLFYLERKLHKHLAFALACSADTKKDLLDEGINNSKIKVIYNGIEFEKYKNLPSKLMARESLNLPSNALIMTVIANLFPYKGHVDLLQALALIKDKLPEPWLLLVVGRDGGELTRLQQQAKKLALEPNLRWWGFSADPSLILAAADFGISSSHTEGFSNAVLESMAVGLPMVVTDISGNNEAIVDGVNGLLVPKENPAAMSQAILRLASDPSQRQAMAKATRARVKQFFSLEKVVNDYQAFYQALLQTETP